MVPSTDVRSGRRLRGAVQGHPVVAFFVLTYLFSWTYWVPVAITGGRLSHFPGLIGPMLAALTVASVEHGAVGVRVLLWRMVRWRVAVRWWAVAMVPAVTGGVGVLVLVAAGDGWPSVAELSTMPGLPAVGPVPVLVMVMAVNGFGEEVGWRGFAWDRLRARHGLAASAGLLGAMWAGWHLPTFWIDTGMRDLDWFVIPGWVVGLMAGSVVLGWLYEHTGSSLLIVAVFHTFLNMASATPATAGLPAAVTTATVIGWSILILRRSTADGTIDEVRPRHPVAIEGDPQVPGISVVSRVRAPASEVDTG